MASYRNGTRNEQQKRNSSSYQRQRRDKPNQHHNTFRKDSNAEEKPKYSIVVFIASLSAIIGCTLLILSFFQPIYTLTTVGDDNIGPYIKVGFFSSETGWQIKDTTISKNTPTTEIDNEKNTIGLCIYTFLGMTIMALLSGVLLFILGILLFMGKGKKIFVILIALISVISAFSGPIIYAIWWPNSSNTDYGPIIFGNATLSENMWNGSSDSPGQSFFGKQGHITWGGGSGWFLILISSIFFIVSSVLLILHKKSDEPQTQEPKRGYPGTRGTQNARSQINYQYRNKASNPR